MKYKMYVEGSKKFAQCERREQKMYVSGNFSKLKKCDVPPGKFCVQNIFEMCAPKDVEMSSPEMYGSVS